MNCRWTRRTCPPPLGRETLHLWCVPTRLAEDKLAAFWELLSPDERQRANRYRRAEHRARFIVGRGVLRTLLGEYLDAPPATLEFQYGPFGKPALAARFAGSGLEFSTSYSHDLALLAFGRKVVLGVDVEHLRPLADLEGMARRYLCAAEQQAWAALKPDQQLPGFFAAWTRKEALVKAIGTGVSFPLEQIAVTLAPDAPPQVLALDDPRGGPGPWWLDATSPVKGYFAALAVQGAPRTIARYLYL